MTGHVMTVFGFVDQVVLMCFALRRREVQVSGESLRFSLRF